MEKLYRVPAKVRNKNKYQAFWENVVKDQDASGMGVKRFCRQHKLSISALKYWKYKKLKDRNIPSKTESINGEDNSITKFIPLQITSVISSNKDVEDKVIGVEVTELKIIFNNGHKLILPLITPEAKLLNIIKAIVKLPC